MCHNRGWCQGQDLGSDIALASYFLWPWARWLRAIVLSPYFFFLFFQFQNTVDSTVCLTEVSSLEGIYPVEDMRPTIISQLENQRSAQRPLTGEKKLRRPLKSKSDLRRWESGRRPCTGILKIRFPGSVQPFFFFFFFHGTSFSTSRGNDKLWLHRLRNLADIFSKINQVSL